ncbi:MAG TPA: M56 family metallopeptidase [Longimicrobiaceae bacterium]|nr:M56 family metallopeptidase [Longimicrobiaceae bacterium]
MAVAAPWAVGGAAVLTVFLKAGLVLGFAWLLVRTAGWASAAVRHGVWAAALVAALALPAAGALLPALTVELPALPGSAAGGVSPAATGALRRAVDEEGELVPGVHGAEPVAAAPADASGAERAERLGGAAHWIAILLGVWLAGLVLRIAWLAALRARVRSFVGATRPDADAPLARRAMRLAGALGIRRRVRVLESARVSMPLTWGATRPVIVLPEGAGGWPEDRLRAVLLHELAHVRRWDYVTTSLAEAACAVYWPLPLAWLARRRLHAEQEQACDDRVIAAGTAPLAYAEHLLAIARGFHGRRGELGAAVAMAREANLTRRVRAILDARADRRPLRCGAGLLALALLACAAIPVAALRAEPRSTDGATPAPEMLPAARVAAERVESAEGARPESATTAAPGAFYRLLEAEGARADAALDRGGDPLASGGEYVVFGESHGHPDSASFAFDVSRPGRYVIWGRVLAPGDRANSFYASLDGGPEVIWDTPHRRARRSDRWWTWDRVSAREPGRRPVDPVFFELEPGRHVLHLRTREAGTRLDAILVTSDLTHRPRGIWPAELPAQPVRVRLEAESAELVAPLVVREDSTASGGRFVEAEPGKESRKRAGSGSARFRFTTPRAGLYALWARTIAPTRDEDSFWIRVNGGPWVRWNEIRRSRTWRWSTVHDTDRANRIAQFRLRAGVNTIELANREGGVRLDQLLVTDDPLYAPGAGGR